MSQKAATARLSQDATSAEVEKATDRLARAQVKVSELEVNVAELTQQQQQQRITGAERERLGRKWAQAMQELSVANVERQSAELQMNQLLGRQQPAGQPTFALAAPPTPKTATTAPPDPFLGPKDIVTVYIGGVVLLLPLVLALSRRLWVRGIRRESLDLENSPRLQRIEQAIESIAIEVERIGEAQRFTTKLFAERQLDAAPRIPGPVPPRREPGVITPH
ncbi:MAG TPA: hypothetical protein VKA54_17865 [Gemmatimonadaceae bacterium]|nr:hypothetical protein [Gemmatimonadaceae bacterium]